jgi:hypothetical protein
MITSKIITVLEKWAVDMAVIFDVMNPIAKEVVIGKEDNQIKIM